MYYVVRVKFQKDGTIKKSELMSYDTRLEAIAKFHTNLGVDMADDTLDGSMCTVVNSHGGQECKEYWGYTDINPRPVEVVPEETTEEETTEE